MRSLSLLLAVFDAMLSSHLKFRYAACALCVLAHACADGDLRFTPQRVPHATLRGGSIIRNGTTWQCPSGYVPRIVNPDDYKTITIFAEYTNITGGNDWYGGVLSSEGIIFAIPSAATSVLRIDPSTDTVRFFGSLGHPGMSKWRGGVLAPNRAIYGIPWSLSEVLKIDPGEPSASTFGRGSYAPGAYGADFNGGVLSPRGMIYAMPFRINVVLRIDPSNDTVTTFGSVATTNGGWCGGVLSQQGMIYGMPCGSTTILKINPRNDTADDTSITMKDRRSAWQGGVITPDGIIFGIPFTDNNVLRLDPSSDTVSLIPVRDPISAVVNGWAGGVLAPNGIIYGIPLQNSPANPAKILSITPTSSSAVVEVWGNFTKYPHAGWAGGVLAPLGIVYGIPNTATTAGIVYVLKIGVPLCGRGPPTPAPTPAPTPVATPVPTPRQCDPGTAPRQTIVDGCVLCGAGQFSRGGRAQCTPCAAGRHAPISGASQCAPCAAGRHAPSSGASQCSSCPALHSSAGAALCCELDGAGWVVIGTSVVGTIFVAAFAVAMRWRLRHAEESDLQHEATRRTKIILSGGDPDNPEPAEDLREPLFGPGARTFQDLAVRTRNDPNFTRDPRDDGLWRVDPREMPASELRLKHPDTCGCDECLDQADAESNERYWRAKIGK
eukprot:g2911.t1